MHCEDSWFNVPAVLEHATGRWMDGMEIREQIPVRIRIVLEQERLPELGNGTMPEEHIFLILSPTSPRPGDLLYREQTCCTLTEVAPCRKLDGKIFCYRCRSSL